MTEDDKEALKEFLTGFAVVCGMIGLCAVLVFIMSGGFEASKSGRFKVVDRYDNRCDVVRYSPGNTATYKYFLDCK